MPTHTEEEVEEAQGDDSPLVLMPHLVRWTNYSLFVAIYRVEGLPNMDDYGSTDAFVSVKLPSQTAVKTKVVRNSLNPTFNELLLDHTHAGQERHAALLAMSAAVSFLVAPSFLRCTLMWLGDDASEL